MKNPGQFSVKINSHDLTVVALRYVKGGRYDGLA